MTTQYIGARYVPRHMGEWDADTQYGALDVVLYTDGNSYTAKQYPPKGTLPTDGKYWALSAQFNQQLAGLEDDITRINEQIEPVKNISFGAINAVFYGVNNTGMTPVNEKLNALFATNKRVFFPAGVYRVQTSPSIMLPEGAALYGDNAEFIIETNDLADYQIFSCQNVDNFYINGITFTGDKDSHTGSTGEGGMALRINNCKNFTIENCVFKNFWGDGFLIAYQNKTDASTVCKDFKIKSCSFYNNGRNDISVIGGVNGVISDCIFQGATRTNPKSAIDLEAEAVETMNNNIVISGCVQYDPATGDNARNGFIVSGYTDNVTITGCVARAGISGSWGEGGVNPGKNNNNIAIVGNIAKRIRVTIFKNSTIANNTVDEYIYSGYGENCIINGNTIMGKSAYAMQMVQNVKSMIANNYVAGNYTDRGIYDQSRIADYDGTDFVNVYSGNVVNKAGNYQISTNGGCLFVNNNAYPAIAIQDAAIYTGVSNAISKSIVAIDTSIFKYYNKGDCYITYRPDSAAYFGNICTVAGWYTHKAWQGSYAYPKGFAIIEAGNCYQVTTPGTSDARKPSFNTSPGATTTDGSVVWTCKGTAATMKTFGQIS